MHSSLFGGRFDNTDKRWDDEKPTEKSNVHTSTRFESLHIENKSEIKWNGKSRQQTKMCNKRPQIATVLFFVFLFVFLLFSINAFQALMLLFFVIAVSVTADAIDFSHDMLTHYTVSFQPLLLFSHFFSRVYSLALAIVSIRRRCRRRRLFTFQLFRFRLPFVLLLYLLFFLVRKSRNLHIFPGKHFAVSCFSRFNFFFFLFI